MDCYSAYLCRGDWAYCLTDDGRVVPHICPKCGSRIAKNRLTSNFECEMGHIYGSGKQGLGVQPYWEDLLSLYSGRAF